jgi:hypothetical protein
MTSPGPTRVDAAALSLVGQTIYKAPVFPDSSGGSSLRRALPSASRSSPKPKLPNTNHPKAQSLDPSDSSVSLKEWLALLGIDVVEFVEF